MVAFRHRDKPVLFEHKRVVLPAENAFYLSAFEFDTSLFSVEYGREHADSFRVTLVNAPPPGMTTQMLRFKAYYPNLSLAVEHQYVVIL